MLGNLFYIKEACKTRLCKRKGVFMPKVVKTYAIRGVTSDEGWHTYQIKRCTSVVAG